MALPKLDSEARDYCNSPSFIVPASLTQRCMDYQTNLQGFTSESQNHDEHTAAFKRKPCISPPPTLPQFFFNLLLFSDWQSFIFEIGQSVFNWFHWGCGTSRPKHCNSSNNTNVTKNTSYNAFTEHTVIHKLKSPCTNSFPSSLSSVGNQRSHWRVSLRRWVNNSLTSHTSQWPSQNC